MTPQAYEQVFGQTPSYNMVQSILVEPGGEAQTLLSQNLIASDGVLAVSDTSTIQDQFKDMIHSMTYVMLVLIVSAGALAFVVLYNLSNINITERMREDRHHQSIGVLRPRGICIYLPRKYFP